VGNFGLFFYLSGASWVLGAMDLPLNKGVLIHVWSVELQEVTRTDILYSSS